MILLIILTYCGLVYAAFRLAHIPVRPITVTTSIFLSRLLALFVTHAVTFVTQS